MSVKVIEHNVRGIKEPNDLTYPWRLVAELSTEGIVLDFAALMLYGNETCTILGDSEKELQDVANRFGITTRNRRLISVVIERNT